jgi:hypothetical protein
VPRKAHLVMVPVDAGDVSCADVCKQAVESLLEALGEIPDARKPRGVRFPLSSVLALCVVAFVCGRQNLTQVMRFGRAHKDLLIELGFPRRRSPSVPTLSRVLGGTGVSDLQQALGRWLSSLADSGRKRGRCAVASVDGKASRSAGVHVLNVFLHDVQQVIWQAPVEEKKNEISAFKEALSDLFETYPFLQILTGDAMFAGAPLCSDLIEHGRHYVFQIKTDQKNLYEKMELVFSPQLSRGASEASLTGEKKRLRHRA